MTSAVLAPLTAEDAGLRMLGEDDLELTRAWRNHPDSREGFHSTDEITPEQHRAWFASYLGRDDDYVFIVEVAGRPVAQVSLYDVADGTAEFGRLLVDPAERGTGLSHRVIGLCLRAAGQLGVDRLHLEVKPGNVRAIRAYERAGFAVDPATPGAHGSLVMRRDAP